MPQQALYWEYYSLRIKEPKPVRIAEKGTDLADSVKGKVNEYADVISEKYDTVKQKISGMASEGKDMLNQARDRGNAMKPDIRDTSAMNS